MKNKGRLHSIALASTALVFVFSILISTAASAAQVTRIGSGSDPAIYGSKVVWTNDGVIHIYDLTAKTDTTVSSSAASHPAIYGNKLVWQDESSGVPRLTVYDIPSGARSYITRDIDSSSIPAMYGNRIVWSANSSVYMRDISISTQTRIASGESPDIYDTKITYSYDNGDMPRIYVYDVITKETIAASPYSGHLSQPHIYGSKVIWSDFNTRMGYISMSDIATGKTIDVTSDSSINPDGSDAGCDTGTHTDINGDKVTYAKATTDHFGSAGVYVYNISTGQSTQVANYDALTTPDVYGSTIVWGIEGDGVNDNGIYMSDLSAINTLPPVAAFTSNVTSGTVPLVVKFTDTSTGGVPTSWIWDFGDGIDSKHTMNATHTFTKPGVYNVSLTVANEAGNSTVTKLNYITVTSPQTPVADFSANVTSGTTPLTVLFVDTSKGEASTSWDWDFGDGTDSKDSVATHTFTKSGSYTVSLTVGNAAGNSTVIKPNYITVTDPKALVADFSSNVTEGYAPLKVQFADLSQNATSRTWDFNNDGQVDSSEINPIYVYRVPGIYTVNLTAGNGNDTVSKTATINVLPESSSIPDTEILTETPLITSGFAHKPAIYGDRVVWHDFRNWNYDVYIYDLSTKKETQITTNKSDQMYPAIYGDRIVWQDDRNGHWDIYMYDLSTSKETRITTYESDHENPDIYGDKIVWEDGRSGYPKSDIYMYDISISKETPLTTSGYASNPAIYGNKIVWHELRNLNHDIYMYDLSTSKETQIANTDAPYLGNLDIYEDKIVWTDYHDNNYLNFDIYMYDLSTSKETQITNTDVSYHINQYYGKRDPAIYGDRIVWADGHNLYGKSDIYMYDLSTSKETQITTDESNQESPAIYGNRIVWEDNRKGGSNIYMCTISREKPKSIVPVVNFRANVISGYAPLSVQFTDLSQYAILRNWNFGDGATSTEQNPMHIYSAPGIYTVNLMAGNGNGTASKNAAINVLTPSSSSGSSEGSSHKSSGGSGGGGGGSPEPAKNVQAKEISQAHVANGKPIKFDFTKNATCVVYVSFDAKKTVGKTTTIAEQLKAKSTLTSNLSTGEVYKYFNLWVGNAGFATEKNIENPVMCFKVEKSWVEDNKIDQSSITLNRYSEKKWLQMPAKLLREDEKYLYFTADTPGFTHFAITGKAVEKEAGNKTEPTTDTSKLEQDGTIVSETQQETGKGKATSIPGFGMVCGIVCLITVFLYKRK